MTRETLGRLAYIFSYDDNAGTYNACKAGHVCEYPDKKERPQFF